MRDTQKEEFMVGEGMGDSPFCLQALESEVSSVQFSSVAQSCPTLCDPMNCSMPGLPVHHQLPEFTQTHVHRVCDAIQPSHPLLSPSPPAPNPSQHFLNSEGKFRPIDPCILLSTVPSGLLNWSCQFLNVMSNVSKTKNWRFCYRFLRGIKKDIVLVWGLSTKVSQQQNPKETQLESFCELQANCKIEFSQDNWFLSMSFSLFPIWYYQHEVFWNVNNLIVI